MSDPAPVAQTFFIDEDLRERYILDGIITLVDAAHAEHHLTQTIAQAQIGFADRLLVSKRDLVDDATFDALSERLTRINRRAPIRVVDHGKCVRRRKRSRGTEKEVFDTVGGRAD